MSSRIRLSLTGLLLISAALALIMYMYRPKPQAVVQVSIPPLLLVNYLVAAHAMPAGTLVREEDFTTKAVVPNDLPHGAITDAPDVRAGLGGSLIRTFIEAGHPITPADFLRPRDRGFLASVLAPGTRAVSIAVDAVSGVSGLIWPGDHVDVVLTHEVEKADAAHHVLSETVLTNARIIGIDQEIVQGAAGAAAGKLARTVTLQVLPEEVEKITVAQHLGKLALSIRAATEPDTVAATRTMFSSDVSPSLAGGEALSFTVKVFQGDKVSEQTFTSPGGLNGR
jgi:pilus assembly protein CpaB